MSVQYRTIAGTAKTSFDFTELTLTTLTFTNASPVNIPVPTNADFTAEFTETFFFQLLNPGNATVATARGTGTINDDDR